MLGVFSFNCSAQIEEFYLDQASKNIHVILPLFFSWSRLVGKTTQLEGEKMQKEAEVQKLMEENARLNTLLDKKEAQLLALNEQCKMMALSASNM